MPICGVIPTPYRSARCPPSATPQAPPLRRQAEAPLDPRPALPPRRDRRAAGRRRAGGPRCEAGAGGRRPRRRRRRADGARLARPPALVRPRLAVAVSPATRPLVPRSRLSATSATDAEQRLEVVLREDLERDHRVRPLDPRHAREPARDDLGDLLRRCARAASPRSPTPRSPTRPRRRPRRRRARRRGRASPRARPRSGRSRGSPDGVRLARRQHDDLASPSRSRRRS